MIEVPLFLIFFVLFVLSREVHNIYATMVSRNNLYRLKCNCDDKNLMKQGLLTDVEVTERVKQRNEIKGAKLPRSK